MTNEIYQLVLVDLVSRDGDAKRKVKSCLLRDAKLSVEESRAAVEDLPKVVAEDSTEEGLIALASRLEHAGGVVRVEPKQPLEPPKRDKVDPDISSINQDWSGHPTRPTSELRDVGALNLQSERKDLETTEVNPEEIEFEPLPDKPPAMAEEPAPIDNSEPVDSGLSFQIDDPEPEELETPEPQGYVLDDELTERAPSAISLDVEAEEVEPLNEAKEFATTPGFEEPPSSFDFTATATEEEQSEETATKSGAFVTQSPEMQRLVEQTAHGESDPNDFDDAETLVIDQEDLDDRMGHQGFQISPLLILALFLAIGFAGVGLWLTLTDTRVEDVDVTSVISKLPKRAEPEFIEPTAIPILNYFGKNQEGVVKIASEFHFKENLCTFATLEITTADPPVSDTEVALGAEVPPWPYKIAVDQLTLESIGNGEFRGEGPAKAYIDYQGQRERIIVDSEVVGTFDSTTQTVRGSILLFRGYNSKMPEESYVVERSEDGEYKLFIKSSFEAELDSEKE